MANEEKFTNSQHNFKYNGDIKIKLLDGDRIYSEKNYHNNGTIKLFNFFMDCLIGNYNVAKSSRPCRLVLFKKDREDNPAEHIIYKHPDWSDETRISTKIYYDNVKPVAADEDGGSIIFHFRVPFIALNAGETIWKLGLYPEYISSFENDLCAFYVFKSENDLIDIPMSGGNFTIVIDWKLTITNGNEGE